MRTKTNNISKVHKRKGRIKKKNSIQNNLVKTIHIKMNLAETYFFVTNNMTLQKHRTLIQLR